MCVCDTRRVNRGGAWSEGSETVKRGERNGRLTAGSRSAHGRLTVGSRLAYGRLTVVGSRSAHGRPVRAHVALNVHTHTHARSPLTLPEDFIGFGKSDKFTSMDDYSHELHRSTLLEFCRILDLNDVTLVVQDWGGLTGLSAVRDMPDRIDQVRRGERSGLIWRNGGRGTNYWRGADYRRGTNDRLKTTGSERAAQRPARPGLLSPLALNSISAKRRACSVRFQRTTPIAKRSRSHEVITAPHVGRFCSNRRPLNTLPPCSHRLILPSVCVTLCSHSFVFRSL